MSKEKFDYIKVGDRGHLITFHSPYRVNVFAVMASDNIFVCDTYLGIEPMEDVKSILRDLDKSFVVFLSHADYDHYWGNGAFTDSTIISHTRAFERIEKQASYDLERFKTHIQGSVEIIKPNILFKKRIQFPKDNITIYSTPGHTKDSASLFDEIDEVLFVGDNIESPIPIINYANFEDYQKSLQSYLDYEPKFVVSGHDRLMSDLGLVRDNLEYIRLTEHLDNDYLEYDKNQVLSHIRNLLNIAADFSGQLNQRSEKYYDSIKNILENHPDLIDDSDLIERIKKRIPTM
jgi:glyoxylase-like metal-dependent hydrolase (beta-lactamase superfamily II)